MPPETSAGKGAISIGSIARRPRPDGPIHVMQMRRPEIVEHVPLEEATREAGLVTAYVAYAVGDYLRGRSVPSADQRDAEITAMDNFAADVLRARLSSNRKFTWNSVAGEGIWDGAKTVVGKFGNGRRQVTIVNDPVENSKAAIGRQEGALVVMAGSTPGGLWTPPEGVEYLDKFVGPAEVKGKISLDMEIEDRLDVLRDVFNVRPDEIDVIALWRPRHEEMVRRIRRYGASYVPIGAGDLAAGIAAAAMTNPDNPTILNGIGGAEEGVITAAAAEVLGGEALMQVWSQEHPELMERYPEQMGLNKLVPGNRDHTFVNFTAITYEPMLGVQGVMDTNNGHVPNSTATITTKGIMLSAAHRV